MSTLAERVAARLRERAFDIYDDDHSTIRQYADEDMAVAELVEAFKYADTEGWSRANAALRDLATALGVTDNEAAK